MIKFKVDDTLPYIGSAASVVSAKPLYPILTCVRMDARTDNSLILTTSDGESWFTTKALCELVDEPFDICVDANDLVRALSNLKGKTVVMNANADKHQAEFDYGCGHFALPFQSGDEFIKMETPTDGTSIIMDAKSLSDAINKTLFATANDELRPVMNGIHFDFLTDGMACGATDGHKLVRYVDFTVKNNDLARDNVTLPKKPASIIKNVIDDIDSQVRVTYDDRLLSVSNAAFRLVTRLCEHKYPDYVKVIPTNNNIEVVVGKDDMVMALKRVAPMCQASSELIKMVIEKDNVTLIADDYDMSKSARESMSCDYTGEPLTIGFKASMLLLLLSNIDGDKVNMSFLDDKHAALFQPVVTGDEQPTDKYVSLLMPMVINI